MSNLVDLVNDDHLLEPIHCSLTIFHNAAQHFTIQLLPQYI